jgi:hypothetical protein
MFRSVGGAFGISLITVILHLSSTLPMGLEFTFISFDPVLLFTVLLKGESLWRKGTHFWEIFEKGVTAGYQEIIGRAMDKDWLPSPNTFAHYFAHGV